MMMMITLRSIVRIRERDDEPSSEHHDQHDHINFHLIHLYIPKAKGYRFKLNSIKNIQMI